MKGPCDEAEHANDPRCTGADAPADDNGAPAQTGEDVSGPCDEAEHANDPECQGVAPGDDASSDDDSSGPKKARRQEASSGEARREKGCGSP